MWKDKLRLSRVTAKCTFNLMRKVQLCFQMNVKVMLPNITLLTFHQRPKIN